MIVNQIELLPLEKLMGNNVNPKRPMALKYKRGLRASLDRFGFAGLFIVAANDDGTFEVLDGNTRKDELEKAGVEQIPCVIYRNMPADERRAFVLSHDRNRKTFDEQVVLSQLEDLVQRGGDMEQLATLAAQDNLAKMLGHGDKPLPAAAQAVKPMASLVLYGPAEDIAGIKTLLKEVKAKLSDGAKAKRILTQLKAAGVFSTDDKFLAVLLATAARFRDSDG